jgi:hypothetical protein
MSPKNPLRSPETGAANGHINGFSARGEEGIWMWALPVVSGAECAWALYRAGFDVTLHGPDHVLAKRSGVPVALVPLVEWVRPLELITILRMTGVTPEQLDWYVYG